jgi:carbon storage regulator CsrA
MLVLTRKQGEVIQIGDSITITVLRMKGKSVRLGIKAPHDFNVIRGELAFESDDELATEDPAEVESTVTSTKRIKQETIHYRDNAAWSKSQQKSETATNAKSGTWSI